MIDIKRKEDCCGCAACRDKCPTQAIQMKKDEEGFFYPVIAEEQCVGCGQCEQVCPVQHAESHPDTPVKAYPCYAKDNELRRNSTSGGMFAVLAKWFLLEKKGIVYGARFDAQYQVVHYGIESLEGLIQLQGSKYVQSDMTGIYREVKEKLKKGRYVLFSGMPCQIEALKNYLGREYERLYLVDIVCFGIGSPGIWKQYLLDFHPAEDVQKIVFKDKIEGWKNWKVKITECGQDIYFEKKQNLYMNSYLQRVNIRPSCFACPFKGLHHVSDFTISDCWGIGEEDPDMNDNQGLSALLIHSKKAQEVFEELKIEVRYRQYDPEALMEGNWALLHAPQRGECREQFFSDINKNSFREVFLQYFQIENRV